MLERALDPKSKWDKYFPKSNCEITKYANGKEIYSGEGVKMMASWAKKHSWQAKKIAQVLNTGNKIDTLRNVHRFVFSNFQYSPDTYTQHVQSPACAWHMREQGINCKGYTVVASAILQELGIKHYMRRVSFDGTNFTHIFVVVPVNNKEYIIDGTLPQFNTTTDYLIKKDEIIMSKYPYVGMNNPIADMGVGEENFDKLLTKRQAIMQAVKIAADKNNVTNIDKILEFIESVPDNSNITIYPTGINYKDKFMPFAFEGVETEIIKRFATELLNPKAKEKKIREHQDKMSFVMRQVKKVFAPIKVKGMNLGGYTPGTTGNFGVGLNVGGSTNTIGGGNTANQVGQWAEAIGKAFTTGFGIYNAIWGDGNNQNQNGGNQGGNNHYNPNNGGNQGGNNYYNPASNSAPKWYKDPIVWGLGLLGIGGTYWISKKAKSKKK